MTITIYQEGKRITARNNEDNLSAYADCSPEDTFDFETGSKLALSRLLEIMKNKHIQVGEYVRITDTGEIFPTNVDWVLDYVKDRELIAKFAYGDTLGYPNVDPDKKYRVRIIDLDTGKAYIQLDGKGACYIIRLDAIERWIRG